MYKTDKQFMRDPATVNCRIYIGNLEEGTTEEKIREHFKTHGNIMGVVVQRGFGFVQFDDEISAQNAIKKEHGVPFMGRKLNVKQAIDNKNRSNMPMDNDNLLNRQNDGPPRKMKKVTNRPLPGGRANMNMKDNDTDYGFRDAMPPPFYERDEVFPPVASGGYPMNHNPHPVVVERLPERNDCEIIVVSKALTEYAEFIEHRLKTIGLIVDLLFPNEDVPIGRVLQNISSRGCLYAILVMPQNEEKRSLTLNILYGLPQEHRNMPVDDAIALLSRNFDTYMRTEKNNPPSQPVGGVPLPLNERHPEPVQILLNLLANNRHLTTLQYDRILKYLQDRRELQYKQELGDACESSLQTESTVKQTELQNRIMSILNKNATGPEQTASAIARNIIAPPSSTPLLNDPTVQKALDSLLLQGDILKNISIPIV